MIIDRLIMRIILAFLFFALPGVDAMASRTLRVPMPSEMVGYYVDDGTSCSRREWSRGKIQMYVTEKIISFRNGAERTWQDQVIEIFTESTEHRDEVLVVRRHDDLKTSNIIKEIWSLNNKRVDTTMLIISDDATVAYKREHSGNRQSAGPPEIWFKCTD